MKTTSLASALAIAAGLILTGASFAQTSGGPDAKGNAPLKRAHTVNDGAARRGANSFTQKQAQEHIEKSGFTGVTNLAKGDDGVWRGQATRDGATVDVALDFKGNVSTPQAAATTTGLDIPSSGASTTRTTTTATETTVAGAAAPAAAGTMAPRRHHHRRGKVSCASPSTNGAACSGVDRNRNGVSDKEDRAIKAGAHP